jgi:glycosyltransferase involved in cell wall biosynthesis
MKKNAVIVTQYFPPEIGGGAHRSFGFAEELSALGVEVTVVTAFPSYLIHKKHARFRFKPYEKQQVNNLTIYRTFVIPSDRGNFLMRLLYYLSFTISSTLLVLLKIRRIDILLAISPPLFTGITGVLAKRFKSAKFILDIGDLWPESAVQLGILKNTFAIRFSQGLERWIYHHCDGINLVTKETLEQFRNNNKNGTCITYVPNFVDTCFVQKREKDLGLVQSLGLTDRLIFGYVGNIGVAQGLNVVVDAAHRTRHIKEIAYVIVGDGVESSRIEREIRDLGLSNIHLLPPVSREEIVNYISLIDVMIIPLVKVDLFRITIPSKLYESMAAEIPVILCVDGEARSIVEQANCGVFAEPGSPDELVDRVLTFHRNRELIAQLGKNGRAFVEERFARNNVIPKYYHELMALGVRTTS